MRGYYGSIGLIQLVLGVVMIKHPYSTLLTITIWLAIPVLLDGLYHCAVCFNNRELKGWGMCLVSGVSSVLLAVLVFIGLPESSMYTIGILIGVNLLTVGNMRIHVAWEGRAVAEGY